MKKSTIKLIVLELGIIISVFFSSFVLSILKKNIYQIIFWIIITILLRLTLGYEKDKSILKKNFMMDVIAYCMLYLSIEYAIGLFIGFQKNPFQYDIIHILKNIIPYFIIITFEELSRYIIVTKAKKNKIVITLCIIMFVIYDSLLCIGIYDTTLKSGIFNTFALLIIPSITKNILLTYIQYKVGYKPTILYRSILELIIYIIPISANLGEYIQSLMLIILPLVFLYKLYNDYYKPRKEDIRELEKRRKLSLLILSPIMIILVILIMLVSGYFKYYILVIATGSMEPKINVGDTVIVEQKLSNNKISKIKIGDVLAYRHEKKVIVHRVVSARKINNEYIFKTKGDNNDQIDNWIIYQKDVVGIAKFKISYIGYPTVLLNRYFGK